MDDTTQLRALLHAAADVEPFTPPLPGSLPRRRRRAGPAVAVAATVVAVTAVAVAVAVVQGRAPRRSGTTPQVQPQQPTPVSAATLHAYRWRTLPPAPIATRTGAAVVWTGSRMIVWGGVHKDFALDDGASYDPRTRTWTKLPAAPLPARVDPVAVWVESAFVVLSGDKGASYDPRANRWTKLPSAPVHVSRSALLLAAGGRAVLATTATENPSHVVEAADYRPATNSWHRLPDLVLPSVHMVGRLGGVEAGEPLVWAYWSRTVHDTSNSSTTTSGVESYALAGGRWRASPVRPGGVVGRSFVDGDRVFLMSTDIWCGFCSHPASLHTTSEIVDARTGSQTPVAYGPLDGANADYGWTGAAVVAVNPDSEIGQRVRPGDAAAWNPTTNRWVTLSPIRGLASQPQVLWAGDRLLVWGGEQFPGHSLTGVELAPR
jgi:hypothetical protein